VTSLPAFIRESEHKLEQLKNYPKPTTSEKAKPKVRLFSKKELLAACEKGKQLNMQFAEE
jgi:hypothetical protein